MDVATATVSLNSNANTNISAAKPSDPDSETPTRIIQHAKPLSFTNGFLKRHHHHHHHAAALPAVVTYKECLKNHAASIGGHALDGCGEFMPSPAAIPSDPTSFKCAACGCHRNFHRRDDPEDSPPPLPPPAATIEYQPHHRHHPPPPPPNRSPNSASPPPISSSYYPSAPHMLLALSGGVSGLNDHPAVTNLPGGGGGSSTRKRFRTKFSQAQKERMFEFAEQVGWKMQKRDEDLVQEFCNEVGVDKGVLKVWMHNNKNTFGKKDANGGDVPARSSNGTPADNNGNVNSNGENTNQHHHHNHHHQHLGDDNVVHVVNNGSSSSS